MTGRDEGKEKAEEGKTDFWVDRAAYFEMENKGEGLYLREYQEINGLDCFHMDEPLLLKVSINVWGI